MELIFKCINAKIITKDSKKMARFEFVNTVGWRIVIERSKEPYWTDEWLKNYVADEIEIDWRWLFSFPKKS